MEEGAGDLASHLIICSGCGISDPLPFLAVLEVEAIDVWHFLNHALGKESW